MEDDFLPGGDVDSDINPYTGERIVKLDSSTWDTDSASALYAQLVILEKRYYIAQTLGKVDMMQQIKMALDQLRASITTAVKRDSKRPIRKRPNSYDTQQRPNGHKPDFT